MPAARRRSSLPAFSSITADVSEEGVSLFSAKQSKMECSVSLKGSKVFVTKAVDVSSINDWQESSFTQASKETFLHFFASLIGHGHARFKKLGCFVNCAENKGPDVGGDDIPKVARCQANCYTDESETVELSCDSCQNCGPPATPTSTPTTSLTAEPKLPREGLMIATQASAKFGATRALQQPVGGQQAQVLHQSSTNANATTTTTTTTTTATNPLESIEAKRERKAAKVTIMITGVFVVCWLPFFITALAMPLLDFKPPRAAFSLLLWLGYVNSMLNPIIYTIFSPDFRTAFKWLLSGGSQSGQRRQRARQAKLVGKL